MTDRYTDAVLDERLRAADPLRPQDLPSLVETEAALRRLGAGRDHPRRRRLGRPLAVAAGGVAALGAALALLLGTTASSPAYAVTRHKDGTITVRLMRPSGIDGANHRLAAMGVKVRIATLVAVNVKHADACGGQPAGTTRTITIHPTRLPKRLVQLIVIGKLSRPDARRDRALIRRARALAASHRNRGVAHVVAPAGRITTNGNVHVVHIYCARAFSLPGS